MVFLAFTFKSFLWLLLGVVPWGILFFMTTFFPGVIAVGVRSPMIRTLLFLSAILGYLYSVAAISGFFALRSYWYVAQPTVSHDLLYHFASVVFAGATGTPSAIVLTIIFLIWPELAQFLFPFIASYYS